jgi:hypothetical protein
MVSYQDTSLASSKPTVEGFCEPEAILWKFPSRKKLGPNKQEVARASRTRDLEVKRTNYLLLKYGTVEMIEYSTCLAIIDNGVCSVNRIQAKQTID